MLILCYARLIDIFTYFCIFPFLPSFVQSTGEIPEAHLGHYCGVVEGTFGLTQCFAMLFWSRLADRWGKKPVLAWCLMGIAVNAFLFGLATSVWEMMLFRGLAGIFSASAL